MRNFQIVSTALLLGCLAALVAASIYAADGRLMYSLDDPYIHLAVAENILRGTYGVNVGEVAAPSSSIAWPFLMAGLLAVGLGEWAPLVVDAACAALTMWMVAGAFWQRVFGEREFDRRTIGAVGFSLLLILAVNGPALPMTGMEHSLHVLCSVATVLGLHRCATRSDASAAPVAAALVMNALVRYEGIALSGAAAAALFLLGRRRAAVVAALLLVGCLTTFSFFLASHGLSPLPSSVLAKSASSAALMHGDLQNVLQEIVRAIPRGANLRSPAALALGGVLLTYAVWTQRRARTWLPIVAMPTIAAVVAHLIVGRYGWFGRYEVYVFAALLVTALLAGASGVRGKVAKAAVLIAAAGCALVPVVNAAYVTVRTPAAARNIFEQQYQMHRFVTEFFPRPIAVNDLGWVSFRNDRYVLDLYGLGSETVRSLRAAGRLDAEAIRTLAANDEITYAMVYDRWFPQRVPATWRRMATLHTSVVSTAFGEVTFYAIADAERAAMCDSLTRFRRTLPAGARLTIEREACGP